MQRSLKTIPKSNHVDVILKYGILEFKAGDVERADMLRTMIKMERELNDAEYQLEQYRKCFGED